MSQSWYKSCLPRVADAKERLGEIKAAVFAAPGVKDAYVFGSLAEHFDNPSYRIKDVNVVVKVPFHSEDLLAVTKSAFSLKPDALEEEGYDSRAVAFSKAYVGVGHGSVDHWAVSRDKKLLHWGPFLHDRNEHEEVCKEAAAIADDEAGITRQAANASENSRQNWYSAYIRYIRSQCEGMPFGWHESESSPDDVLKDARKL